MTDDPNWLEDLLEQLGAPGVSYAFDDGMIDRRLTYFPRLTALELMTFCCLGPPPIP